MISTIKHNVFYIANSTINNVGYWYSATTIMVNNQFLNYAWWINDICILSIVSLLRRVSILDFDLVFSLSQCHYRVIKRDL